MALEIPFMKKKEAKQKTPDEINAEIYKLKDQLRTEVNELKKLDPDGARMSEFGLVKVVKDKNGKPTGFIGQEKFEKFQHRIVSTEFPQPHRRFRLVLEYPNFNIEQTYYWFLRYFNETWGFEKVEKVIDTM